ncbi:Plant invertase/pectin methylesterase inhibitor superfamily protein [Euphorbia peplus]|nr:Plant invertase/pectin methylesterase inhibitor superfamily protein [Euphorbia peplus]
MENLNFLLHSYLIFLLFINTTSSSNNLIQKTCKKCAQNDPNIAYNFCLNSLQSFPGSHCVDDLQKLGLISLKLTAKNVTDTKKYIKGLLKKQKPLDSGVRACLADCFEVYSDASSTVKEGVKDYKAKKYEDVNIEVSSVLDASTTCEDGFDEKGISSMLQVRNNHTFQLSAISLSIINMLH